MIDHVHKRLLRWAHWVATGMGVSGLGYSDCALEDWETPSGLRVVIDPGYDEEAAQTDRAIALLSPEMKRAVRVFYLHPGSIQQKASDCGCHRVTLYKRIDVAHVRLADLFLMPRQIAAGWQVRSALNEAQK